MKVQSFTEFPLPPTIVIEGPAQGQAGVGDVDGLSPLACSFLRTHVEPIWSFGSHFDFRPLIELWHHIELAAISYILAKIIADQVNTWAVREFSW